MNPVDTAEPLRSRWSPSIFDAEHMLTDAEITRLLEAAQWAPSGGNRQPWRFVVATRGSTAHAVLTRHLRRGNAEWVPRAAVVFIAIAVLADEGEEPGDPTYPVYGLSQAAAHLTLQARAMDLHAHQFAGFDHEAVADELGVPARARVVVGIAVGVRGNPDEVDPRDVEREQRPRTRFPLAEIAYGDRWGSPWPGLV